MSLDVRSDWMLFTPKEAAALRGIGRTKLYSLITSGQLASVRIDSSRRIPRTAIETFVAPLTSTVPGWPRSSTGSHDS